MELWQPVKSTRRGQKAKRSDPVSCTNYWSSLQEHTKRKKKGHAGDVERESDGSRPVEADGPRTKQPSTVSEREREKRERGREGGRERERERDLQGVVEGVEAGADLQHVHGEEGQEVVAVQQVAQRHQRLDV